MFEVGGNSRGNGWQPQLPIKTVLFSDIKNNPCESMGSQAHEGGVKAEEFASLYSHRPQPNMQSMRLMADKFDFSPTQVWFGDPGRAIAGTTSVVYIYSGNVNKSEVCVSISSLLSTH